MHRQNKKIMHDVIFSKLNTAFHSLYYFLYDIGSFTIVISKTGYKLMKAVIILVITAFLHAVGFFSKMMTPHLKKGLAVIRRKMSIACFFMKLGMAKYKQNINKHTFLPATRILLNELKIAMIKHKKQILHIVNYLAPATAVIALLITVNFWAHTTFALEVKYSGDTLGYISDESVFSKAADLAEKKVDGGQADIAAVPQYTIKIVDSKALTSADDLSNKLLSKSKDVAEGYGLYADNKFIAAAKAEQDISSVLDNRLNAEKAKYFTANVTYATEYKIEKGIYSIDSIFDSNKLDTKITDDAMPMKAIITESFSNEIPYETIQVKDNTLDSGKTKVKTEGQNGIYETRAEVTYINGSETGRVILSTKTVQEPKNKVVITGTKLSVKVTKNASAMMMIPIAKTPTGYISSPFGDGRGHTGLDFATRIGTSIYAAADGRVIAVNNGGGYGLSILVDHGNGITTLYAHCSSVLVTAGQTVTAGQEIAKSGSSGNSTGPHLHFEVRVNDTKVNPAPYLGLK